MVSKIRIDCGPGHRVYFVVVDRESAVLMIGTDRTTWWQEFERFRDPARDLVKMDARPFQSVSALTFNLKFWSW